MTAPRAMFDVLDRMRRETFWGLWEAGLPLTGLFVVRRLSADHGVPEDVLPAYAYAGMELPLSFDPSWPMNLVVDAVALEADFVFGTRRCRCRLAWRALLQIGGEAGGVRFESADLAEEWQEPPVETPAPRPSVEHDGNVARVDFTKGRKLRPVGK